jgi:hypothetical protein
MTSVTAGPTGQGAPRPGRAGRDRIAFAAVLLIIIGSGNVMYGVAAIHGSDVFAAGAHYAVAGLPAWGWVTVLLGVA